MDLNVSSFGGDLNATARASDDSLPTSTNVGLSKKLEAIVDNSPVMPVPLRQIMSLEMPTNYGLKQEQESDIKGAPPFGFSQKQPLLRGKLLNDSRMLARPQRRRARRGRERMANAPDSYAESVKAAVEPLEDGPNVGGGWEGYKEALPLKSSEYRRTILGGKSTSVGSSISLETSRSTAVPSTSQSNTVPSFAPTSWEDLGSKVSSLFNANKRKSMSIGDSTSPERKQMRARPEPLMPELKTKDTPVSVCSLGRLEQQGPSIQPPSSLAPPPPPSTTQSSATSDFGSDYDASVTSYSSMVTAPMYDPYTLTGRVQTEYVTQQIEYNAFSNQIGTYELPPPPQPPYSLSAGNLYSTYPTTQTSYNPPSFPPPF
ncbi:hypothetical protein AB6A40_002338 [Gnathostoma spinigerum]|uniref:Uncharacterized protein n=1 Tax=Gnathostoma spinigerum TaxID=75299 RepID=A0ABD6E6B5_9BILA